ncbi:hypothetical protein J4457_02145 [Candidatus Woesearchaeota archaeon]|nr:hypothetical protein [Candidatus Woesearchaeota archaeon]
MTKPDIIKESAMSLASVKEELARIKKRDGELNFRANKTEEYLNSVVKTSPKKAKELYDALVALNIPRIKDIHLNKIVDLLPKTVKELKVVLQGYTLTLNNEGLAKIVEVVASHSS